ncbi:MAG: GtrA family protein [Chloroflexi bacterium]|nr:GtrA family protein [Chloroflexota bacterium]
MKLFTDPRERSRFLRFAIVGAIGAVVDFSTFNLLNSGAGLEAPVAQALSFTAAVTSNFILNRNWTFPDSRSKPLATQAFQYLAINLIGLMIRTPVFVFTGRIYEGLLAQFENLPLSQETLAHNLALATAIGVVLFWNFFVNRYWTYNDVDRV